MSDHYEVESLGHKDGNFEVKVGYFYEDIHPSDLFDTLEHLNPETTLFIVVSKSFSTLETLKNHLQLGIHNYFSNLFLNYISDKVGILCELLRN